VSIHVRSGAAIQCIDGVIWLTQEDDAMDYCVPAGTTFRSDRSGRTVVSAIESRAVVVLHEDDEFARSCRPGAVTIDSMERLTRGVRRAQQVAVASMIGKACAWVSSRLRRPPRTQPSSSLDLPAPRLKGDVEPRGAHWICGELSPNKEPTCL
jgi:hypothetical protein